MAKIDTTVDRSGRDIIGDDEYGRWFGTEDAPIPLDWNGRENGERRRCRRYVVEGYAGPEPFDAVVFAFTRERVEDYFLGMRIRDLKIEEVPRRRGQGGGNRTRQH